MSVVEISLVDQSDDTYQAMTTRIGNEWQEFQHSFSYEQPARFDTAILMET